jgi:hypothetical protein
MKKPVRGNDLPIPLIVGLIIGAVLIGIALLGQERRSLVDVFDEAPTPELPALFANFGDVSQQVVTAWLSDGTSLPAVTPQAVGPRIAVHVDTLHRVGTVLEIRGMVLNQTDSPLTFSAANFRFSDATDIKYGVGDATQPITVTDSVPFAFQIPVPPSRALTMTVVFDPDPPLVITLLQERSAP